MANRTDTRAMQVHGQNPQGLVDQIVRNRIYSSLFWKEKLAGVNAEDLVDRAISLKYVGGCYGGLRRPSPFICMVLKLLQIAPQKEILYALIENSNYKYVRALGMFYLRLIGRPEEVYLTLEKMYSDSRKVVERKQNGEFEVIHMDVLADRLLNDDILYDIVLPRLTHRDILEEMGKLEPRISPLEEELEQIMAEEEAAKEQAGDLEEEEDDESEERKDRKKKKKSKKGRSRSRSREKKDKKKKKWKKILKKKRKERKKKEKKEKMEEETVKKPKAKEGSVEYWNEIRANLGLSKLKEN